MSDSSQDDLGYKLYICMKMVRECTLQEPGWAGRLDSLVTNFDRKFPAPRTSVTSVDSVLRSHYALLKHVNRLPSEKTLLDEHVLTDEAGYIAETAASKIEELRSAHPDQFLAATENALSRFGGSAAKVREFMADRGMLPAVPDARIHVVDAQIVPNSQPRQAAEPRARIPAPPAEPPKTALSTAPTERPGGSATFPARGNSWLKTVRGILGSEQRRLPSGKSEPEKPGYRPDGNNDEGQAPGPRGGKKR